MFELKVIPHSEITLGIIDEIIKIKSVAWPYSFEEQLNWIDSNLKDKDLHLFLLNKTDIVAYLNLISIELIVNKDTHNGYGVGNVCAKEIGKGYGYELMRFANDFLINNNNVGLLFCKQELLKFYSRLGWILIEKRMINISFNKNNIEAMIFNVDSHFDQITYQGISF